MVISSLYSAFHLLVQYFIFGPDVPACGNAGYVYTSGLCLLFLSVLMTFCYILMTLELRMAVVYTDYYTYLRRMGYAGRFGTGVCICMLL